MDTDIQRRERIFQFVGLPVAAFLFLAFFLPRGASAKWSFAWNESGLTIVTQIFQVAAGLALAAALFLPVNRLLKGIVLAALGLLLSALITLQSIGSFSGFFNDPAWIIRVIWVVFPAIAACCAFCADSEKDYSARNAFGLIGGSVMLFLAFWPLNGEMALTPLTALSAEVFSLPSGIPFALRIFLFGLLLLVSLGPVAGGLLAAYSAAALVRPDLRLPAAGPVAGIAFLFWVPALAFYAWLATWAAGNHVFTSYFVSITPDLGATFLLAAAAFYTLEGLYQDPEKAVALHPGLGLLVTTAWEEAGADGADVEGDDDEAWPPPNQAYPDDGEPLPPLYDPATDPNDWRNQGSGVPTTAPATSEAWGQPPPPAPVDDDAQWSSAPEALAAPASNALDEAARSAWEQQDWDQALYYYGEIFRSDPQRTDACRALADIHYGLGNLDEAERYYRLVLVSWPDDTYAQNALEQIAYYRNT